MQDIMGSSSDNYVEGSATRGILQNYIATGADFPDILTNSGHNLGELFSDSYIKGGSDNKYQFNNLFLQSVYDETGFYKYSCFENYAYLPSGSTDFTVYEQIGTPSNRVNDQYNSTNDNFGRGQFMPYNPIGSSMEYRLNLRDPDLGDISSSDPRYAERVYYIENESAPSGTYNVDSVPDYVNNYNSTMSDSNNPETYANYFFGMTMEAKFTQNPGGIAENGDPMVYEFNGDDDLWIYIDGVLVLDLGGVHDAFRGKINFQNGKVTSNAANGQDTYIKQMFKEAGRFPDGTAWKDSRADEYFTNGGKTSDGKLIGTFKDYSTHDFKMYYMERGASASNLFMQFNLPVLTESQFRVKKEMPETKTGQTIQSKYADAFFYYEAYKDEGNGLVKCKQSDFQKTEGGKTVSTAKYEDDNSDVVWKSSSPDETKFELKPGQTAIFPASSDSVSWYVVEVEPETGSEMLSMYDISNSDQDTTDTTGATANVKTIKNRNIVTYFNEPDDSIVNELQIKKRINGEAYNENDAFELRIFLEKTDGKLAVYSLGEYYQIDKEGRYVYYVNGNRTLQSENPDGPYTYVFNGETVTNSPTPRYAEHTSVNGSLGDFRDGDTIIIKGLLEGTDFYVYERTNYSYMSDDATLIDGKYVFEGTEVEDAYIRETHVNEPLYPTGTLYNEPDKSAVDDYASSYEKSVAATGTIIQDKDAKVLVKNKPKSQNLEIKVEKQWNGIDDPNTNSALSNSSVTVTLGRYIVSDKAGNFTIQKIINVDQGSASDAGFSAQYFIRGVDAAGNNREYGPYSISGVGSVSGTIAPGTYKVYEENISADESYTWTHSSDPVDLVVIDGQDGNPNPVTFTSNAGVKAGSLWIKSTLDPGGSSESFSSVKYTVYDSDGVTRAKYPNGDLIPEVTFSEANTSNANGGKLLTGLKIGSYVVKESALPEVDGYVVASHTPSNSNHVTAVVVENTDAAKAEFSTTYEEAASGSTYKIGKPDSWNADSVTGNIDFPVGTRVQVTFSSKDNWDRIDNCSNIHGGPIENDKLITYGGTSLSYSKIVENGNYRYSISFTVVKDAVLRVNINGSTTGNDPEVYDISVDKVTTFGLASRRTIQRNNILKSISAGTDSPVPDTYGDPPTDPLKNYVDDSNFKDPTDSTKPYTLTLNQANEWKWNEELPVADENGNKYYYYIKEITESNMPAGTTCEILLDGKTTYLVGDGVHVDKDGNPLPLIVKNTVVDQPEKGSLKITKEVTVNGNEVTDHTTASPADGTYTFKLTKKNDLTFAERTVTLTVTNGVAVTSDEIAELEAGIYIISENTPDNGTSLTKIDGAATTAKSKEVTVVAGATGANAATITFTNNIGQTEITVKKVDADKASNAADRYLDSAKFSLYDEEGHVLSGISSIVISNLNTGTVITPDVENKFTIPITGIKISGLPDGSYQLVEREAPAGYVITNSVTTFTVSQGTVTAWSLNGNAGSAFEIPNPPGAALPSTGGPGTRLFTILGSILILGAGVLLWRRRRLI